MPPSVNELSHLLPRSHSKDSLHLKNNLVNNRYGGGANSIVEAGRVESQRLLMERYRRIDVSENINMSRDKNRPTGLGPSNILASQNLNALNPN